MARKYSRREKTKPEDVEDVDDDAEHDKAETPDEELLEEARERFKLCLEAEAQQRKREIEDLKFQVPELQWDEEAKRSRVGDAATPGRPMLSIPKLDQPRMLVLNQFRSADLGIGIHPISEDADDQTAEMLQGLYRHIERKSHAERARYWAYDRAVTAGRGAYEICTEYDEEGDPKYRDQKIVIRRILHQESVYFDPAANEPDYSDARFCFVVQWVPWSEFKREYPKAKITAAYGDKLRWEGEEARTPEWVREKDVLLARYWYKRTTSTKISGKDADGDEYESELKKTKVFCATLTGMDVLAKYKWLGQHIPIVAAIGRELQPFDEERRFFGMIRPARDGQRLYNYAASNLVESMAAEPKAPYIVDPRQIEGYEHFWNDANRKNFPYLFYNATVEGVNDPLPPPARSQVDTSRMQLSMMALQEADQFIQASTAVFDPSLGKVPQKERSGKAIMALQSQAEAGTSHYMANFADISLPFEAAVILDLIPKVYDRPGRITRIVRGDDKKSEPVMLGQPYVMDPQTKRPMPAKPDPYTNQLPQGAKHYDLSQGVYGVAVTVGKSLQTRLEAGAEFMGELITKMPALVPMIGDLVFRFRDEPGAKEISERLAKVREHSYPGIGEGEDGQVPPEQAAQKAQAMGQQMQQMQQQLQQAMEYIKTEQAKQAATMQKAQLDSATKIKVAEINADWNLRAKGIEARVIEQGDQIRVIADYVKALHEQRMASQEQAHEHVQNRLAEQHGAAMAMVPPQEPPEPPEAAAAPTEGE